MTVIKKLLSLIIKSDLNKIVLLVFLLIFGMILEMISLGLLYQVLETILGEQQTYFTIFLINFLNFNSPNTNYYLLLLLLLFFVFKTFYLTYLNYKQNKFLALVTSSAGNNLYKSYLDSDYEFHLKTNSANHVKNLQIEMTHFYTYLLALITLVIESSLAVAVIIPLILIRPLPTIILAAIFSILAYLFFQYSNKHLLYWGKQRAEIDSKLTKQSLETFGIIKEINVYQKTELFESNFFRMNIKKGLVYSRYNTLSQISRHFLELITIIGLVGFIVIMLLDGSNQIEIFSTLGIFVAGIFRLLPSINRIISSSQNLKYYKNSISTIYKIISQPKSKFFKPKIDKIIFNKQIEIDCLSFSYDEKLIFSCFSATIKKGKIYGLKGESGKGKSTLVNILMGLLHPHKGNIKVDGISITDNLQSWKSMIGYVPQNFYISDNSIAENIALGYPLNEIDLNRVTDSLKSAQIFDYIDSVGGVMKSFGEMGKELSGGQMQRISLARALYNNPKLLILDEATSALDKDTELRIMNTVLNFKGDKTVIIISHSDQILSLCDNIINI
jgi:ATP-binding cassette, subfamily B, bacterial PglK